MNVNVGVKAEDKRCFSIVLCCAVLCLWLGKGGWFTKDKREGEGRKQEERSVGKKAKEKERSFFVTDTASQSEDSEEIWRDLHGKPTPSRARCFLHEIIPSICHLP